MNGGKPTMTKKLNVESFNLDHTRVAAPYVREVGVTEGSHGDRIHKYDIRLKQPNKEHMEMPALHSLEHLLAEKIRDHLDSVVDLSPMGCQTGFYLSVLNQNDFNEIENAIAQTLKDVLVADEVPACNEIQCGWAASHSLEGAKLLAAELLAKRHEWKTVFKE